jgi:hypothetical protein
VVVSLLHGAYNTFSDTWPGLGVVVASLFIFIGYVRAQTVVVEGIVSRYSGVIGIERKRLSLARSLGRRLTAALRQQTRRYLP